MSKQRPIYIGDWAREMLPYPEHELVYQMTIPNVTGWDHCYGCPDCGETALLHRATLEHPKRWDKPGRCSANGH
jgi:hypothetical protein